MTPGAVLVGANVLSGLFELVRLPRSRKEKLEVLVNERSEQPVPN